MARQRSGNSIVVEGVEQGSVFPTARDEATLDVLIDGRREPFDVRSGAYGANLAVVGPGTIRGPVLAGSDLRLEVGSRDVQRLLSGISAHRSVLAEPVEDRGLHGSPAATAEGVRYIIRGDVLAETVVLRNALVIGSVSATKVRLESSIVMGSIVCRRAPGELHAICSTFGLFDVNRLIVEGPNTIRVPGGASDEEPDFRPHVPPDGTTYPSAMRYLPLCHVEGVGCGVPDGAVEELSEEGVRSVEGELIQPQGLVPGICCEYWLLQRCPFSRSISLFRSDFAQMTVRTEGRRVSVAERFEAPPTAETQSVARWFFGVGNRALRIHEVRSHDESYDRAIHAIFAYEHLDDHGRKSLKEELDSSRIAAQETMLFKQAIADLDSRF